MMQILTYLSNLPKELIVIITSALPIIEVRGAVPLGFYLKMDPWTIFWLCAVGSSLPILPVRWFLDTLTERLRKNQKLDRFFEWLFTRTRAKSKIIEDFELIGLTLFVAIPLPGTGAWTGTVAAYLFGFSYWKTFLCCALGTAIATAIMTLGSLGIVSFFN